MDGALKLVQQVLTLREAGLDEDTIAKSISADINKAKDEEKKIEVEVEVEKEKEKEDDGKEKDKEEMEKSSVSDLLKSFKEDIEKSITSKFEDIKKSHADEMEEIKKSHADEIQTLQKSIDTLKEEAPVFKGVSSAGVIEKSRNVPEFEKTEEGKIKLSLSRDREVIKSMITSEFTGGNDDIKKSLLPDMRGYCTVPGMELSKETTDLLQSKGVELSK